MGWKIKEKEILKKKNWIRGWIHERAINGEGKEMNKKGKKKTELEDEFQ